MYTYFLLTLLCVFAGDLPTEQRGDPLVKVLVPQIKNEVKLEEHGDTSLRTVGPIMFSPDGKQFLIVDATAGAIFVYDHASGKLKHYLKPTFDWSDSLALRSTPLNSAMVFLFGDELKDNSGISMPVEVKRQLFRNKIGAADFVTDSEIVMSCQIMAMERKKMDPKGGPPSGIASRVAFIYWRFKRGQLQFTFPECGAAHTSVLPLALKYFPLHHLIGAPVTNFEAVVSKTPDSCYAIALFHIYSDQSSSLFKLPAFYIDAQLWYKRCEPTFCESVDGTIYSGFLLAQDIYSIDSQMRLRFTAFNDAPNRNFFAAYSKLDPSLKSRNILPDSVGKLIRWYLWDVMSDRTDLIIISDYPPHDDSTASWSLTGFRNEQPSWVWRPVSKIDNKIENFGMDVTRDWIAILSLDKERMVLREYSYK